jgi:hypothetical protein
LSAGLWAGASGKGAASGSSPPESPASPIHRWREPGFLEKATFWAVVTVNDKPLTPEKKVLKVKAAAPERK